MKKLLIAGIVGSMAVAGAAQAATMALSIKYLGSTTGAISGLNKPSATSPPGANVTLTQLDFTQAASHSNTQNHWFEVDMAYTESVAGEDFQQISFDIHNAANTQKVDRAGSSVASAPKWYADNPNSAASGSNVFSTDGDGGTAGDLLSILALQQTNLNAAITQTGEVGGDQPRPTPIGWFVLKTSDNNAATVTADQGFGGSFGSFINNQNGDGTAAPAIPTGVTSGTFTIQAVGTIPEPTSLALLSLGAIGMIRRRRA